MVLSSLPNLNEASNGRFSKVFHFDHKNTVEKYAKKELRAVTALWPGLYYSNMAWPQYCRKLGMSLPLPAKRKHGMDG